MEMEDVMRETGNIAYNTLKDQLGDKEAMIIMNHVTNILLHISKFALFTNSDLDFNELKEVNEQCEIYYKIANTDTNWFSKLQNRLIGFENPIDMQILRDGLIDNIEIVCKIPKENIFIDHLINAFNVTKVIYSSLHEWSLKQMQ